MHCISEAGQQKPSSVVATPQDKEATTNKAMNLAAKWIQLQAQFALRLQQQQQLEADEAAVADKIGKNNAAEPPRFPLDLSTLGCNQRNVPFSNPSNMVSFASLMIDSWPNTGC